MQITESDKSRLAEIGNAVNNAPWGKPAGCEGMKSSYRGNHRRGRVRKHRGLVSCGGREVTGVLYPREIAVNIKVESSVKPESTRATYEDILCTK